MGTMGDDEGLDSSLGLGELAQLTVNNEAEAAYDVSYQKQQTSSFLKLFGLFTEILAFCVHSKVL